MDWSKTYDFGDREGVQDGTTAAPAQETESVSTPMNVQEPGQEEPPSLGLGNNTAGRSGVAGGPQVGGDDFMGGDVMPGFENPLANLPIDTEILQKGLNGMERLMEFGGGNLIEKVWDLLTDFDDIAYAAEDVFNAATQLAHWLLKDILPGWFWDLWDLIGKGIGFIADLAGFVYDVIDGVWNTIEDAAQLVADGVRAVGDFVEGAVDALGNAVSDILDAIGSGIGNAVSAVGSAISGAVSWIKSPSCFITTATCGHRGLPDDCRELTLLREFRDTYMLRTPQGRQLVEEYYQTAPDIVQLIAVRSDRDEILESLYSDYIVPSANAVAEGRKEDAMNLYSGMMRDVEKMVA